MSDSGIAILGFSVLPSPAQLFKKARERVLFEQLATHAHDNPIPL